MDDVEKDEDGKPKMPLIYIFMVFFVFQSLTILCLLYSICKRYRRVHFELRVQVRRLRRKHSEVELKELSQIVKQTKQLAEVQKTIMIDQLRGAENDANNSNYEDSRAKIDLVRSVVIQHSQHNNRDSLLLSEKKDHNQFEGIEPQSRRHQ